MRHLTRWSSAALSQMLLLAAPLSATTFTVMNTADGGPGSLRQAILDANASAGADAIAFAIPGSGVQTIHLSSPLPAISDPVVVDGYTQPGASPNTLSTGDNAVILVEIDGASAGSLSTGLLNVMAAASTIRGLAVINAQGGDGISLAGGGSLVAGNFIGLRPDGTTSAGNGCAGVRASSSDNIIGGSSPADRNVISATAGCGIDVVLSSTNNLVLGNYIGTNSAGTAARGGTVGIDVTGTSHIIGGTSAGSGNLISGHSGDGIRIRDGSFGNLIRGNFIGTNATGTAALGNSPGISITDSPNNVIGGSSAAARNVISGNFEGLVIAGNASASNVIQGNFIGTDSAGSSAVGNVLRGIGIDDAPNTMVGGIAVGSGNVISGNSYGIKIASAGAAGTFIGGNYIGLNAAGNAAVPNLPFGIWIVSAANTSIGSGSPGSRNVISGNSGSGIRLFQADGTRILGNYIGVDASGMNPVNNIGAIFEESSSGFVLGSAIPGRGNLISGGVSLFFSINPVIRGNTIGTNVLETAVLPNTIIGAGISLTRTTGAVIGGSGPGEMNLVCGNDPGISIGEGTATSVLGNRIGTNRTGTLALGNLSWGVLAEGPACIGDGTTQGANIIAFNGHVGVVVISASGVSIRANRIFSNDSNPFIGTPGLGIDLDNNGPTKNDPGDADSGANGLQNFPVIRSTTVDSSNTTIVGSFNSMPSTAYTLEFYSNPACSPSSYGEGKSFLGSAVLMTDASGDGSFNLTFPTVNASETVITSTATDPNGNTSEFSACATVPARFYSVTPCRVADTRGQAGPYGGPALAANADRNFVIGGQCGIPATAASVAFNFTVTQPTALGDLRAVPAGSALPLVSTLNWRPGQTRANNAVVPLGPSGDILVHVDQPSGTVHFIIDLNGYFQ